MFWVGLGMCGIGFIWLFTTFVLGTFVLGPEPASNFAIISAALFVGGLVLVAGGEICEAIRELKVN